MQSVRSAREYSLRKVFLELALTPPQEDHGKSSRLRISKIYEKLCRDCDMWKSHGFSPACKYCDKDGDCPECGEQLTMGEKIPGPAYTCPNGHKFTIEGREYFNPTRR